MTWLEPILLTIVTASTPLLLAALGELICERAGVLNLGVEGMMIIGAVCGFAVAHTTGSMSLGVIAAVVCSMIMSLLFGFLTLHLLCNQVATGLALTILGLGLSGLIGESFIGEPGHKLPQLELPFLSELPYVGRLLFAQDALVYISILGVILVSFVLFRTRLGLIIRATGDNHRSAHALGYSVRKVRYGAVLFGGACSGLAGAYLSLAYTPQWTEGMTAGRGWIALALVVFASWRPLRLLLGAYLFGAVSVLQFHAQAYGIALPSQLMSSLPYIVTIFVLVIISGNKQLTKINTPACLGKPFRPDR
ncbi:ABC transporter permease [Polycladidibacter stylochi]|uniref:ABC transporter permease n=1 Tax=Polycladidibacter stylochi TaxID=1807766 RepID=UPI000834404A|nr:ABC transporter permease [Pseudovibrio stylochi]